MRYPASRYIVLGDRYATVSLGTVSSLRIIKGLFLARQLAREEEQERHRSLRMETVAVADATNVLPGHKKSRIQVSNTKKPLFFYVNLAKKYMQQHNEVELSALGMAIATVVIISEILKNNGLAVEKKILTSTVDMKDETKGRLVQKAKIEILLGKTKNFEDLIASGFLQGR
ncbi:uncharacterized protein At2g34160-like, partial [Aristolochia californica]|uniref:uncharacterized protein At2g34160-like n=1 Tax=Aristolochia californica TaxID=171875 RepID=UPI0035D5F862